MPTLTSTDSAPDREVFWDRYKKEVMAVLILALVGVAAFGGYQLYSNRQESAGAAALSGAKTPGDFQKVISQYPATSAGASAYLLLADAQRHEKKIADADPDL